MKDRYIFPAFFCYHGSGKIGIVFPDLPGCVSQGDDEADAARMAKEALAFHLWGMEEDGDEIPAPTSARDLMTEPEQVIVLIEAFMPPFRERMNSKAMTKAVTVPRWLDIEAKAEGLNYSQILQDGLMERLGIRQKAQGRKNKASAAAMLETKAKQQSGAFRDSPRH